MRIKKIAGIFVIALTIFTGTGALIVAALPWIPGDRFWFLHLFGLLFPYIILFLFLVLIYWAFRKSKWAWFCLVVLLLSGQQILYMTGFHFKRIAPDKPQAALRVLSWNVSRWDEKNKEKRGGESYRRLMLDFIEEQDADVLCFQEYFECSDPRYYEATIPALQKMGYSYYHFFPSTILFNGSFRYGLAIFSRTPILEAKSYPAGMRIHSEGVCYADISHKGQRFRVFNSHFESPGFTLANYDASGNLKKGSGLVDKISTAYAVRHAQIREAGAYIKNSPWPVLLCTDLGDIPNSNAYSQVRALGLKDAYLDKNLGVGATYRFLSPTLRIDYTFCSSNIKIVNLRVPHIKYSDHYPLITDINSALK